jgi:sarcosine oxidase subunit alpha
MTAPGHFHVIVDGAELVVPEGTSVAAAVAMSGALAFRQSPRGAPRAPLCGMGICFECRVELDGLAGVRSCLVPCHDGMVVRTGHA